MGKLQTKKLVSRAQCGTQWRVAEPGPILPNIVWVPALQRTADALRGARDTRPKRSLDILREL